MFGLTYCVIQALVMTLSRECFNFKFRDDFFPCASHTFNDANSRLRHLRIKRSLFNEVIDSAQETAVI